MEFWTATLNSFQGINVNLTDFFMQFAHEDYSFVKTIANLLMTSILTNRTFQFLQYRERIYFVEFSIDV